MREVQRPHLPIHVTGVESFTLNNVVSAEIQRRNVDSCLSDGRGTRCPDLGTRHCQTRKQTNPQVKIGEASKVRQVNDITGLNRQ